MTALVVEKLTKRFGGLTAARDISFSVASGEILGLIGPNGSGKSTVMKSILGVERPNSGSVKINGVEVAGWPPHKIARLGVGMVFQHSRPLHRQTVLENIALALTPDSLLRLWPDPKTLAKARALAQKVGLGDVLDAKPATLPYADLRRIELAKAIARDPAVVLVDEPFAGLTARETGAFAELIAEMRRDGHAVLIVDHNVKSVASLADRVFAMYVGERIAEGSPQEVMNDETVRRVYLGGELKTAARSESAFADAATPFLAVEGVDVFYERARLWRKCRCTCIAANSSPWSGSTARARRLCSTRCPGWSPSRATSSARANRCAAHQAPPSRAAASCRRRKGATCSPT